MGMSSQVLPVIHHLAHLSMEQSQNPAHPLWGVGVALMFSLWGEGAPCLLLYCLIPMVQQRAKRSQTPAELIPLSDSVKSSLWGCQGWYLFPYYTRGPMPMAGPEIGRWPKEAQSESPLRPVDDTPLSGGIQGSILVTPCQQLSLAYMQLLWYWLSEPFLKVYFNF